MTGTASRGFTLLELMVAMAILGVVIVLGYSGLHLGMRYWDAAQRHSHAVQAERNLLEFLRQQLTQICWPVADPVNQDSAPFAGERQELRFVAPLIRGSHAGGLYEFWIRSAESPERGGGLELLLEYQPFDPDRSRFSRREPAQRVLAKSVTTLSFAYYGALPPGNDKRWNSEWRHPEQPPDLVRVQLGRARQGQPKREVDYVIALHQEAPVQGFLR